MSDRAPLTLRVHDCPAEQAAAVLAAIADAGLHLEFDDLCVEVLHTTKTPYVDFEAILGAEKTVADALIAAAPQCSFTVWQEPFAQADGELVSYEPVLGRFESGCDAHGVPHIGLDTVDRTLTSVTDLIPNASAGHLAAELRVRLGVPWTGAFDRCEQRQILPAISPLER